MARRPLSTKQNLMLGFGLLLVSVLLGSGIVGAAWKVMTAKADVQRDVALARARVPPPTLPPRPTGKTELVTERRYAFLEVPFIKCRHLKCAKSTRRVRTLIGEDEVQRFVGARTEEVRQWEATVAELEQKYEADMQAAIDKDEDRRLAREKARREEVTFWATIVGSGIGGIAGLAGAGNFILALLKYLRERRETANAAAPDRDPKARNERRKGQRRITTNKERADPDPDPDPDQDLRAG